MFIRKRYSDETFSCQFNLSYGLALFEATSACTDSDPIAQFNLVLDIGELARTMVREVNAG